MKTTSIPPSPRPIYLLVVIETLLLLTLFLSSVNAQAQTKRDSVLLEISLRMKAGKTTYITREEWTILNAYTPSVQQDITKRLNPEGEKIVFNGSNLSGREISPEEVRLRLGKPTTFIKIGDISVSEEIAKEYFLYCYQNPIIRYWVKWNYVNGAIKPFDSTDDEWQTTTKISYLNCKKYFYDNYTWCQCKIDTIPRKPSETDFTKWYLNKTK